MMQSRIPGGEAIWRRPYIAVTVLLVLVLATGTALGGVIATDNNESHYSRTPRITLKAGGVACAGIETLDARSGGWLSQFGFEPYCKFRVSSGPSLGAVIDFPVSSWAMVGAAVDVSRLDYDDTEHWSYAWTAHCMFGPPKDLGKIVCRFGAGCGVLVVPDVILLTENDYSLGSSDHLALKLFAQVGREPKRGVGFVIEPQVLFTLPSDLTYEDQVKLKPLFLLRVGAVM